MFSCVRLCIVWAKRNNTQLKRVYVPNWLSKLFTILKATYVMGVTLRFGNLSFVWNTQACEHFNINGMRHTQFFRAFNDLIDDLIDDT